MIFRSISNDNVFMVGDVKQSIYRFRQAMPEIFLRKKQLYKDFDGVNYPAKIIFNKNFRSRKQVTDSINFIFEMIMSERMGEIEYEGEEKLYSKASYIDADDRITEIHLIPTNDVEEEKSIFEAKYTASKIKELLDSGFLVQDGEKMRNITPSDICILMRSPKNKAEIFVSALESEGINSFCDVRESFLRSREISSIISLLKAITNPLDDIAVVGSMMSPIFAFSADEIAEIRAEFPKGHIYPFLLKIREENMSCRIGEFVSKIEEIRGFCTTMSSADALSKIYKTTDYYGIVGAMVGGEQRLENLHLLVSYAKTYERYGHSSIDGFVAFIGKMLENSLDMQSSQSGGHDGVTIMSIHRSKGLEFPCVFLCDTAKKFNKQDINRDTVLHSYLGFGAGRRDFEKRSQYTTVPLEADKLELTRSMLSEEMRILYVALTRAKEKLFIIGSTNDIGKKLLNLNFALADGDKISPYNVREAESYLDWILMPLIHHIDAKGILGEYLLDPQPCEKVSS
ncbi:MAG: 3'-5' exonuclease, partial [Oscillospiraceae bacterium]